MLSKIQSGEVVSDIDFDQLFPESVRAAAEFHFTPVDIALAAAEFLVQKADTHVLDIGSGAGKFCLIGAASTKGFFTGVEQRKQLVAIATELAKQYQLQNTQFINANLVSINFSSYDAFYIFNPFMEHRTPDESLDADINIDRQLYEIYSDHVRTALDNMRVGTRLATYFSYGDEVPESYIRVGGDEDRKLRFWVKG